MPKLLEGFIKPRALQLRSEVKKEMSISYSQKDNVIVIENNKIVFDHKIGCVRKVNDTLIILLEIPNNVTYLRNVFGVDKTGKIKWQIQNVEDIFQVKNLLPFDNLMIQGNKVFVSDFYGRRLSINPTSGEVLSSDIVMW